MKVSIFGLGYVGTVCGACLAKAGHTIIGVDPQSAKVERINAGQSPIVEPGLSELIQNAVKEGALRATENGAEAVLATDMSIVSVGTPSLPNGSLDLGYIKKVSHRIGEALRDKDDYHLVVVRSTVLPGTCRDIVIPALEEASGKTCGKEFGVAFNPEFLRESSAVHDFYHPPKTVVGAPVEKDADTVASLYEGIEAPVVKTTLETAELVKYLDNAFHALKVVFGNEVGQLAKSLGLDSHEAMNIFCLDSKLNLSAAYLKPGFAFGGSCLPKDLRALTYEAKRRDLQVPLLSSLLPSNEEHIRYAQSLIAGLGKRKLGFLGFAFKAGTDDLRESPIVELVERLLGKGYDIKLFDENVSVSRLVGANRAYVEEHLPHVSQLMVEDMSDLVGWADVLVIGNKDPKFERAIVDLSEEQHVVDLVRVAEKPSTRAHYHGLCW